MNPSSVDPVEPLPDRGGGHPLPQAARRPCRARRSRRPSRCRPGVRTTPIASWTRPEPRPPGCRDARASARRTRPPRRPRSVSRGLPEPPEAVEGVLVTATGLDLRLTVERDAKPDADLLALGAQVREAHRRVPVVVRDLADPERFQELDGRRFASAYWASVQPVFTYLLFPEGSRPPSPALPFRSANRSPSPSRARLARPPFRNPRSS